MHYASSHPFIQPRRDFQGFLQFPQASFSSSVEGAGWRVDAGVSQIHIIQVSMFDPPDSSRSVLISASLFTQFEKLLRAGTFLRGVWERDKFGNHTSWGDRPHLS